MTDFFRWQPLFESSIGRSTSLREIAPKSLTLRRAPRFRHLELPAGQSPPVFHETMFHEIDMVPVSETRTPEMAALASETIEKKRIGNTEFYDRVFQALLNSVEAAWIPERFHVVLHSGGYDSRLISLAIRRLYEKNGTDWLGDLLFLEVEGETAAARQAILAEGWDESRLVVYNEGASPSEHHAWSCRFDSAWKRLNGGMWPRLFNYWWDPIEWLQAEGRIPEDDGLQGWSGYLANDTAYAVMVGPGLDWLLNVWPHHAYMFAPMKGEWVLPYLSLDFMRALIKYGDGQSYKYPVDILNHIAPEVGRIGNPNSGGVHYRTLSDRLFQQVMEGYRGSWYGREIAPHVPSFQWIGFEPWWGHWGLASFCEELRHEGYGVELA